MGIDLLEETKPLFLTGDKTQHDKAPYKTPLFLFSEASLVTSEVDYSINFGWCSFSCCGVKRLSHAVSGARLSRHDLRMHHTFRHATVLHHLNKTTKF